MRTLSESDASAVLSIVGGLAGLESPEAFPPSLLKELGTVVGTSDVAYSELDRRNERHVLSTGWWGGEGFVARPADGGKNEPYWRLRHSHPCCSYREQAEVWTGAYAVSDFCSLGGFRQTAIWNELYRDAGINYWLDVGLTPHHGCTRVFIFTHERHDFDERSRLILELVVPHLERRATAVATARAAVDALSTLEEEASPGASEIVVASLGGAIEFATPQSHRLLERYFGRSDRLPEPLEGLLHGLTTVVAASGNLRLTVRGARVSDLLVLLLAEADVRGELLTRRQREVLGHAAEGLTDAQIGERLEIAEATVRKHLEHVFDLLDVHNRTSAIAVLGRPGSAT
jgi:DNA-binding CsgD family transcriptional regulator